MPESPAIGPRPPKSAAGGAAAIAGFRFQAQLGALIAAGMVADRKLNPRFGAAGAKAGWLGFETGAPVDDLMVGTSAGGIIAVQAKTAASLSLSQLPDRPFTKVVDQFVCHWFACRDGDGKGLWDRPLNPDTDRLVLAVGPRAPSTIRFDFPDALRACASQSIRLLNEKQSKAYECFTACVRLAWQRHAPQEPVTEELLRELAQLVTVASFDFDGADGERIADLMSEQTQYPDDGEAAVSALVGICNEAMSRHDKFNAKALRRKLELKVRLQAPPDYRSDIEKLEEHSNQVTKSLERHEAIETEADSPVRIERECQAAVNAAAQKGSFLVVGEPGTGKSGVLNALARSLMEDGEDVLALAVDGFSATDLGGIAKELGIEHQLPDVLEAWDDGQGPLG